MKPLEAALTVLAAPVLAQTAYLVGLSLLSKRRAPPEAVAPRLRFNIVVPAHDEAEGIETTVSSLLALDYPRALYRVVVVADNCTDDTATRAARAGATVFERTDPSRRGKGYALDYAFQRILADDHTDAVVVVDADSVVSGNLLRAFSARMQVGAEAVQADYSVRNPDASWRPRLMTIALACVHTLRGIARERLGVSAGLRGNGMCFSTSLLRAAPHEAFSVVEDLEYGIRLGQAGYRVHYADEARVFGEMPTGDKASRTQRERWEAGRWRLARAHAASLLGRALRDRDPITFDLALDLLTPPLGTVAVTIGVGLAASGALSLAARSVLPVTLLWGACAGGLVIYVARGWQLSGTGSRGLRDLACAPSYLLWKLSVALRGSPHAATEWVRTARAKEPGA